MKTIKRIMMILVVATMFSCEKEKAPEPTHTTVYVYNDTPEDDYTLYNAPDPDPVICDNNCWDIVSVNDTNHVAMTQDLNLKSTCSGKSRVLIFEITNHQSWDFTKIEVGEIICEK